MERVAISAVNLTKRFGRRALFQGLSFNCSEGESLAITGPNGSGKSTLLLLLAMLAKPSSGTVSWSGIQAKGSVHSSGFIGFCSPAMNLYGSLTVYETMSFAFGANDRTFLLSALEEFGLGEHVDKEIRLCSSGIRQRLKLLCALINKPKLLFLDEPCSNLDKTGKELLFSAVDSLRVNSLIVIATNEDKEADLCGRRLELG